jgi:hypothetical protein
MQLQLWIRLRLRLGLRWLQRMCDQSCLSLGSTSSTACTCPPSSKRILDTYVLTLCTRWCRSVLSRRQMRHKTIVKMILLYWSHEVCTYIYVGEGAPQRDMSVRTCNHHCPHPLELDHIQMFSNTPLINSSFIWSSLSYVVNSSMKSPVGKNLRSNYC